MKFFFIFFLFFINYSILSANNSAVILTEEEKEFLKNNQPLKLHNEKNWPPYNFNEYATPKGFSIDYMNLIAQKLDIQVEYIFGPTWDEFMEMLKKDELDVIINIAKNKEREVFFDFTTPFHNAENAIYVKKGNENIDSLKKLEGKTIVMPKGFFAQQYIENNYPEIKQILVKDSLEALKLLSLGKADATVDKKNVLDYIISTQNISNVIPTNYVNDERLVSEIRLGTSKNKPLLNSILQKAQDSISEEELLNLKRKWFGSNEIKNERMFLSAEEKKYLKEKQVIKICSAINLKPIEFYENGLIQGINSDLLNILARKLEIKFEKIKIHNFEIAKEYLRNGTCEVLSTTIEDSSLKNFATVSHPISSYRLAIITQKNKPVVESIDEILNQTLAKKSTSENIDYLRFKYPSLEVYETKDDYETLESVNNNKAYYAIEPLPVVAYYMSKYAFNNIFISRYIDLELTSKFIIKKEDTQLLKILNKAILEINEQEQMKIFAKWTNLSIKEPFDYAVLWKTLVIIFVIIAILTYRQFVLKKHNNALKIAKNEIEEKNRLIAKQKELFEKLYAKSADGVLLIKNKKITDCNEASSNILKYTKEELIEKCLSDISPIFQENGIKSVIKENQKIDEALKIGQSSFEWIHQDKEQNKLWIEVVLTVIEINNELVIHTVIRDINQRKTMEKELESLTNRLEERIEEEIKKNEEKTAQLIQQSRLAQMGEMLSMIAHQWRQPLTAISATTNNLLLKILLNEKIPTKEVENELTLINEYSQHLSLTIDDFRNFFKSDKVKKEIKIENIIEKALSIIKTSFESKNVTLTTSYKFNQDIITYDAEVQQVILIILKNAEDALIEKDIKEKKIFIETSEQEGFAVIKIEDNAGGISNSIINRVFDPYFSTKKEKDGTGIGLYMSKIIINEHCMGSLYVENGENGAIFEIRLPKKL